MKKIFRGINAALKFVFGIFIILVATVVAMFIFVLYPTRIKGRKNLRKLKGGAVVVCNHYSNFDPVLLCARLFKFTFGRTFLAKKELSRNKFFGWILSGIGCVYIDRSAVDRAAMREVDKNLKKGKKVLVFPEGTRNKNEESEDMQGIKSGAVFFAKRADAYILPMRILHRSKLFRMNTIVIGEPYKVGDSGKLSTEEEVKIMEEKFENLKNC